MKIKHSYSQGGFTLIEMLVSVAIFVMMSLVIYDTVSSATRYIRMNEDSTTVASLAGQYLEIARNLPYSLIGTVSGNPHGSLPDSANKANTTFNGITYQVYYIVAYIDDVADGTILAGTDPAPNDYKQIKLYIQNTTTGAIESFLTTVVPKGLENLASGGALSIQVINAVGQPVSGASISITNTAINPSINLTRTSDANGKWIEVGLPNSSNSYHLMVTKSGYSTDATYPITLQNPNPIKSDATIANGQVTSLSFAIDQPSTLTFNTLNQICTGIPNVGLEVRGSKLIGTPNVIKFDNTYTSDSNGQITLANIEWDNYVPALTGTTYMVYGSSPIQQVSLLPNTTQLFTLVLGPKTTNSLLVIVKDAATGNAIEGANVDLQKISPLLDDNKLTGGSLWSQQDWTGGGGQTDWSNTTRYDSDDGNVSTTNIPIGIRLQNSGGVATAMSGALISSSFDTGASTTQYTTINWQPTSQDPATSAAFQIATNNDDSTWDFLGPDGTASTYYTTPGTTISSIHNSNRYIRYKVYLSTTDTAKIPVITSVSINYVSGCFTPGQVLFTNLVAGQGIYQAIISMAGYQTQTITNLNISGNNVLEVLLAH